MNASRPVVTLQRATAELHVERRGERRIDEDAVAFNPRDDPIRTEIKLAGQPGGIASRRVVHAHGVDPTLSPGALHADGLPNGEPGRRIESKTRGTGRNDLIDHRVHGTSRGLRAAAGDLNQRPLRRATGV